MSANPSLQIPNDPEEIKELILRLWGDNERLRNQLDQLQKRLYGQKSERWMPEPGLFAELLQMVEAAKPEEPSIPEPAAPAPAKRNGHGRSTPPAHLPRVRIPHELPPEACKCQECGGELKKIGEEKSEQLDYLPAVAYVREHVRFKYACPACQGNVVIAPAPAKPIAKGLLGPGLLAQILVGKYCDHLPLHRQEAIFKRHGIELNRSTQGDAVAQCSELLKPLVERMSEDLLKSRVLHTDDTPVPVQDGPKKPTRKGRLWVYVGDKHHPQIVYDYTPGRTRDGPERFMKTYTGYLQADAYAGYDQIYARGKTDPARCVVEVACWAHARRKFVEAETSDMSRALAAKTWIRLLYDVEDEAKALTSDERRALRQEKAAPLLKQIRLWLEAQATDVLPKSPMGEAIQYALNQWDALERYTEDGDLAIDNNTAERALRPVTIGRKNWVFCGSDKGGERAAILYSLIETCKRHHVEPFAYLRDILDRIGDHPVNALYELFPQNWTPRPQPEPTPVAQLPVSEQ